MTVFISQRYYLVIVSTISCFFAFAHRDITSLGLVLERPIQELSIQKYRKQEASDQRTLERALEVIFF